MCENGADGIAAYREDEFSLVITDVRLPDMMGLDVLRKLNAKDSRTPVIVMTAFGTISDAVEAMKLGAFDYITKPFSLDEFNLIVKRAIEVKELREDNIRLRRDLNECYGFSRLIGENDRMKALYEMIEKVSKIDSTVLIIGESGTGKELVASTIHYQSKRAPKPFVKVNCAALPENLVESELFGYEKGAFTGAAQRKRGRFDRADKGTIFLDEIADIPRALQAKLLRVLQDGSFERLGGTETVTVNVRVIAATNADLGEAVKSGDFREDLYYRLNVIPINIPPLRMRGDDISLLISHFLEYYNSRFGKRVTLSPEAVRVLMEYEFPGNVRELENIVERSVALATDSEITVDTLPSVAVKDRKYPTPVETLSEVAAEAEKEHIGRILKSTGGNRTKAAEILGISRKTLWEKMNSYGID
jgi:DNA-binding NtrC family response regulator